MTVHFAAPSAQTTTHACGLPIDAMPAQTDPPVPAGEYTLAIVESRYASAGTGRGMVLACMARIVGGDRDGQPYYLNYNLENDTDVAVEIGQREFAGLRRAMGVLAPENREQLHHKPFRVVIGLRSPTDTGETENYIKQYLFEDAPRVRRRACQESDALAQVA